MPTTNPFLVVQAIVFCGLSGSELPEIARQGGLPLVSAAPGLVSAPARRGSALLAVLWLSVALSTIALTVAGTVRGEVDRATTASDDTRAYFLAQSAIQRAILYIEWGRVYGPPQFYQPGMPPLQLHFPTGEATVDVISESSKININVCLPAELFRLLSALNVPPDRAQLITEAVIDWRTFAPGGQPTAFDMFYLQQTPSFMARHASFQEIEDLLLVRGVTPDIFYGTWDRDETVQPPRLTQRIGLRDCVSLYSNGSLDVNATPIPVLLAAGTSARRRCRHRGAAQTPAVLRISQALRAFTPEHGTRRPAASRSAALRCSPFAPPPGPVRSGGVLSDMRRTVAALIKFCRRTSRRTFPHRQVV